MTSARHGSATAFGVFTGFSAVGGVERSARLLAAALADVSYAAGVDCRLLGLNDPVGPLPLDIEGKLYGATGFARDKGQLVARLLRQSSRGDWLILGHPNLGPVGLMLSSVRPGIRYMTVAHGFEVWTPLPPLRRLALRRAHRVLAVSCSTAHHVAVTQGVRRDRIRILPNSFDRTLTELIDRSLPARPVGSRMLLTVGRLKSDEPGKGVDEVLRVLPRIRSTVPAMTYVVAGEGDDRTRLQDLASDLRLDDCVRFLGAVSDRDLAALYRECDLFVMPSRQEGFGIVFLEAMAFGKPVIAARTGGAETPVLDGITGFLVEDGDPESLADHIVLLLTSDELREQMGAAGKQRVFAEFSFECLRERLAHILQFKAVTTAARRSWS